MVKYLSNCRLYNAPDETVHIGVENGKIVDLKAHLTVSDEVLLDAAGMIVAPGLIDTHVHGAGGANPIDGKEESLHTMARTLCLMGTTAFTPTTFYYTDKENDHLDTIARTFTAPGEAEHLGLHLEGPFINPLRKGGIKPRCIATPDRDILSDVLLKTRGRLAIMTAAPEIPWNDNVIQLCKEFGIVASFGHSDAGDKEARDGFEWGMSLATHLNNAMRKYDRHDDPPFKAILESGAYVQMIADGRHLDDQTVRHFHEQFGTDRIVLITDGIESCGLPDGEYDFGGIPYRSENGLAFYADGSGMIGTSLPLFEIMKRFKAFTGCSLRDALKTVTENPATCLDLQHRKGFIKPGYDADLILIDGEENLKHVVKSGLQVL